MREIRYNSLPLLSDDTFKKYGKVYSHTFPDIVAYMEDKTTIPEEGNIYVASDEELEKLNSYSFIKSQIYGGQDIQLGYCNGKNDQLKALEFHKGSEIMIAITDFVLILGDTRDIEGISYPTDKTESFYVHKGDVFELYSTTLHFSPCKVGKGFNVVILPRGTNTDLDYKTDGLLFNNNKWMLAHPDNESLLAQGVVGRLIGDDIRIIE